MALLAGTVAFAGISVVELAFAAGSGGYGPDFGVGGLLSISAWYVLAKYLGPWSPQAGRKAVLVGAWTGLVNALICNAERPKMATSLRARPR